MNSTHPAELDTPVVTSEINLLEQMVMTETKLRLESGSIHIYDDILQRVESAMISTVMNETDANLTHAAQRLGISRPTLRNKIRAYMTFK